ncbi:MAG: flagellar hook-length control protein FliK, partial [Parasporobacterium sp.]|nr:flagellar hook-length control protein FliK [Parasporobacterium sp.]
DCAKEAFGRMTPEGMEQAATQGTIDEMTPEELLWQLKQTQVDEGLEEEYYREQIEEFAKARGAEEQVLKLLTGYDMPITAYNVLAANQMLHNRNGMFKTLFEHKDEEPDVDLEAAKQGILEDFAEAVKTPEDMAKAQKKLADVAENVMKTMAEAKDVQSFDIRDLKILRQEIELGTKMAKEENYAIPVLVADEYTNIQLKIVRGTEKRGRLDVVFDSPKLGKVAARFQIQGEKVKGYIASDSNDTIENLKKQQDMLQEQLSMEGTLYPNLDMIQSEGLDINQFALDSRTYGDISKQPQEEYEVQTKTLYGLAKVFIGAVKQLAKAE